MEMQLVERRDEKNILIDWLNGKEEECFHLCSTVSVASTYDDKGSRCDR
jgi:hypothetical protein